MTLVDFDDAIVSTEAGGCVSSPISSIPPHASGLRYATRAKPGRETTVGVDSNGRVMYYADRVRGAGSMESVIVDKVLGTGEVWRSEEGERSIVARVSPDELMQSDKVGPPARIVSEVLDGCAPAQLGQRGEVRFVLEPLQAKAALLDGRVLGAGRFMAVLPIGRHTVRVFLVGCEPADIVVEANPLVPQVYRKSLTCGDR